MPDKDFKWIRYKSPHAALGHAVDLLMRHDVFRRMSFGELARLLAGQVNRGRYFFALRGGEIVGFCGWALADREKAEAWLKGDRDAARIDGRRGECCVINIWQAADAGTALAMLRMLKEASPGTRYAYARRIYPDGRVRPVRLKTHRHAARMREAAANAPEDRRSRPRK